MASLGKHVMLSYEKENQKLVETVYNALTDLGIQIWMDIKTSMPSNSVDSMAYGVDHATIICCFMSPSYQASQKCKKELNYAESISVPIVPVMLLRNWKPTQWLGLITAGLLWIDFRDTDNIDTRINSLAKEIVHRSSQDCPITMPPKSAGGDRKRESTMHMLEKNPGRAFRHLQTGLYLAEYFDEILSKDPAHRTALILCEQLDATSYWVEEKPDKKSSVYFYKNYQSKKYLGYDPNGDYVYTNQAPYGAEEWVLMADESSTSGERSVVLFANYGKKFITVRNSKLTGVANRSPDCVWILA